MTIGMLLRRGVIVGAVVAGGIWIIGSFASRSYRSIRMSILVPADAELGRGTAIVAGRATVGTVTEVGEARWGLPLEIRTAARHRAWIPVVLAPGESASSGEGASLLRAGLDPSDSVLTLASDAAEALVLRRDAEGGWLGARTARATPVLVNGDSVPGGKTLRAWAGDVIALGSTEVRLGPFGKFQQAELRFTTRKLCPDQPGGGWFPDAAEQAQCTARKLRGASQLELGSTFGLTKPVLKVNTGAGEETSVRQADSTRLPLGVQRDLQVEIGEILSYLNSPVAARPRPRTHFEQTIARVNQTLQTVDSTAGSIGSTVRTLKAAMGTPDGVGPVLLGTDYGSLRTTMANAARITGPLADTTRTLVVNAGLGPLLSRVDSTLDSTDVVVRHLRGQVDRLAPRIELAVEGTARTIEGAEGTLVALKAAAEDIQSIKRGAQGSKGYAIGGGALLLLSQLVAGIAAFKFIFF